MRNLIKTGDMIIIAALLLTAAVLFMLSFSLGGEPGGVAVVSVAGQEYARLPLGTDTVCTVETGETCNVICVENGEVFMRSADCPDGLCIEQGRISLTGEVIVCLPGKLTVTIEDADEGLDSVVS